MIWLAVAAGAAIGLLAGYLLRMAVEAANRKLDEYLDGIAEGLVIPPEILR
jgi:hypothetical protein